MSHRAFAVESETVTLSARQSGAVFVILAAVVYTAVFAVTHSSLAAVHPGRVGVAAMCDLLITVPFLYYLLIVRRGRSSWMALFAVSLAGARAASLLLPAAQQANLPGLRWLGVPFELWVITAVIRRLRRMDRSEDAATRIHTAVRTVVRNRWLAEIVAAEIEVFYLALFSWRAQPQTRPGYRVFPCGESSGYFTFALFLAIALVFEGVPMHLLLHRWSAATAWIATGLDVYALLWIVALVRSLQLRPILVGADSIVCQAGLAWHVEIARDNIKAIHRVTGDGPPRKEPGYLRLVVINPPQWLIELHNPVTAQGMYGRRRTVSLIGLAVDDGAESLAWVYHLL